MIDALPAAGGFVVYEVGIGFEDGLSGSVASCNAVFQGPFNQLLGLAQSSPQDVDKEEFAAAFDGLEGYDEELDSWFRTLSFPQPFPNGGPNGGEVGSMTYSYRAGTGGGSMITDFVPLAHLVLPAGEFFSYDLEICRDGDCFVLLPEPAAAELRLAALLAVAVLARRATGRHARARALG